MVNVNVPKVQFVADLEHVLVAAMQINSGKMEYVFVFLDMKRIDLEFVFRLLWHVLVCRSLLMVIACVLRDTNVVLMADVMRLLVLQGITWMIVILVCLDVQREHHGTPPINHVYQTVELVSFMIRYIRNVCQNVQQIINGMVFNVTVWEIVRLHAQLVHIITRLQTDVNQLFVLLIWFGMDKNVYVQQDINIIMEFVHIQTAKVINNGLMENASVNMDTVMIIEEFVSLLYVLVDKNGVILYIDVLILVLMGNTGLMDTVYVHKVHGTTEYTVWHAHPINNTSTAAVYVFQATT